MFVHPAGVDILDHLVGGLTPGFPCVLSGPSGSGRTVLCLQLVAASLDTDAVVSLLCNEPAALLLREAQALGLDFAPALRSGRLALLELDPGAAREFRISGAKRLVECVRAEQPQTSVLIVDPMTALTAEVPDAAARRRAIREFVDSAGPVDMLLSLESEQVAEQPGLERALSEVCASLLRLQRDATGKRSIVVEKTRCAAGQADACNFVITAGGAVREREPDSSPAAGPAVAGRVTPTPRPRVLVVDGDPQTRNSLGEWLAEGHDVRVAGDGLEAMTTLLHSRPDLVILDLVMPRISGYEVLSAFQRAAPEIPMLVTSSRVGRPADRLGPLVLGATDLLTKPLDRFELLHKVALLLRLAEPAPRHLDVDDAERLFGKVGESRLLTADAFAERVSRAFSFGKRFSMPSTLVALRAASRGDLDHWIEIAERSLRFEDAVLRISARRALMLLVATDLEQADGALARLLALYAAEGGKPSRLGFASDRARPLGEERGARTWRAIFSTTSAHDRAATALPRDEDT